MVVEKRIRESFKGYAASQLDNFEYSSADEIYVIDVEKDKARITTEYCEKACIIHNSKHGKKIGVLSIDHGLLEKGNCDFATFDDETKFVFVEMKMNATTSNILSQDQHRIKSLRQVSNTINKFKEMGVNLVELKKEAVLCMPRFFPAFNSSQLREALLFIEDYGIEPKQTTEVFFY